METKRELTISDFIYFALIYDALDYNLNLILDGSTGDYVEELTKDLTEIYDLLVSAVTFKNGKIPEYWYYKISALHIAMSHKTANEIYDKYLAFRNKAKENYQLYNSCEQAVISNITDYRIEFAFEGLSEDFCRDIKL